MFGFKKKSYEEIKVDGNHVLIIRVYNSKAFDSEKLSDKQRK